MIEIIIISILGLLSFFIFSCLILSEVVSSMSKANLNKQVLSILRTSEKKMSKEQVNMDSINEEILAIKDNTVKINKDIQKINDKLDKLI
jgi:hypothetical protein|nr:MAG TPA: voltage-gated sodium channel protein [Caudoviricetes sp.]